MALHVFIIARAEVSLVAAPCVAAWGIDNLRPNRIQVKVTDQLQQVGVPIAENILVAASGVLGAFLIANPRARITLVLDPTLRVRDHGQQDLERAS
jgi:hypothetical protein